MKEAEIRPKELHARLLELNRRDVERFFADRSGLVETACPACDSAEKSHAFTKLGFAYALCSRCESLYLSPRPTLATMDEFYRDAESVKFWASEFYRQTAESRRERMIRPRAQLAVRLADAFGLSSAASFADVGPGYGLFLEEVAATGRFATISGIEPASALAALCRAKGFTIVESLVETVAEGVISADLLTCFEVLEHVTDSAEFLAGLRRCLKPGGILLATTLTVSGFDIQVLWERAKAVYPPHHANLLSLAGYRRLFERCGFDLVELSTPGELDVDIVRNSLADEPLLPVSRFERLLSAAPEDVRRSFQDFLKRQGMSSHLRVVARLR